MDFYTTYLKKEAGFNNTTVGSENGYKKCRFKIINSIGEDSWEWCTLFNAQTNDLNCECCEHWRISSHSSK